MKREDIEELASLAINHDMRVSEINQMILNYTDENEAFLSDVYSAVASEIYSRQYAL